jgi:hypothetical protein
MTFLIHLVYITSGLQLSLYIGEIMSWLKMMSVGRSTEESYNQPLTLRRKLAFVVYYSDFLIIDFISGTRWYGTKQNAYISKWWQLIDGLQYQGK